MLSYPLTLSFKLLALAPEVDVKDAAGQTVLYVKQKLLSFKENVRVFSDSSQQNQVYQINSDSVLNFSSTLRIRTADDRLIGTLHRQGMASLWRASYTVMDEAGAPLGSIHERNPWVKVLDGLLAEIPFVGWLVVTLFNPSYIVELNGTTVMELRKRPSVFARSFTLDKLGTFSEQEESLLVASVLTMVLHERTRE